MRRSTYPEHAGRWIVTVRRVGEDGELGATLLATADPEAVRAVLGVIRARAAEDPALTAAEVEPCAGS